MYFIIGRLALSISKFAKLNLTSVFHAIADEDTSLLVSLIILLH